MTAAANAAVEAAAGAVTANVVKAAANAVAKVVAAAVNVVSAEVGAVAVSVPTSPKRAARSKPAAPAAPMNEARVPRRRASLAVKVAARVAVNLAQTAVADRAPSVNRVDPPQPMIPWLSSTRQRRSRRSWTPFRLPRRWTQARPGKVPDVAVVVAGDVIGTSRVKVIRQLLE